MDRKDVPLFDLVSDFDETDLDAMRRFGSTEYVPLIKWIRARWPLGLIEARSFADLLIVSKNLPEFANRRILILGSYKEFRIDDSSDPINDLVCFTRVEWSQVEAAYNNASLGYTGNKILAIKAVRTIRALGLKEAKDLVELAIKTGQL